MGLRLTCRQVSLRLLMAEQGQLSWWERLPMRLHIGICRYCQGFERQMRLMSRATAQWRRYSESDPDGH